MSSDLKTIFSTTITDLYVNNVCQHLSEWLKNKKDVNCSCEELCEAFNVPYTPRVSMSGLPQAANMPTSMPNLPGYFAGTGSSPKRRGGGRKKAPVDPNGPTCVYVFLRGAKKGQTCGEQVAQNGAPGSNEYCKPCLKKRTVQNRINSGATNKSTVKPPIMPGGMVSMPEQKKVDTSESINAVSISGTDDMFKDLDSGFILKRYKDGTIAALSIEENGTQRPLNREEKEAAQLKGLSIVDSPELDNVESVPTIPSVPQVPSSSSKVIPTVPQVDDLDTTDTD